MRVILSIIIFLMSVAFSSAQSGPWVELIINNKKITYEFKNSKSSAIVDFLSKESGITIVNNPSITQLFSFRSEKGVMLVDAFHSFNIQLSLINYEIVRNGNLLVIMPRTIRSLPEPIIGVISNQELYLRVYLLYNANSQSVARSLKEIFTIQTNSRNNFLFMQNMLNPVNIPVFQNENVQALPVPAPSQIGNPEIMPTISFEPYTNSIVARGTKSQLDQIGDLLAVIDNPIGHSNMVTKILNPEYASVMTLQDIIMRSMSAVRLTGSVTAIGYISNNSLIIICPEDLLPSIEQIVISIDIPNWKETTTRVVIDIKNSNATTLAEIMRSVFRGR